MSKKIYVCLKVRNEKDISATEKLELHFNMSIRKPYRSWYGLNSLASSNILDPLLKQRNAQVLFYISPNERGNNPNGIVYACTLKKYITYGRNRKVCPHREIPNRFRSNKHSLFLKIEKLRRVNNFRVDEFVSLRSGIRIPQIRSGFSRVIKR